MTAFVLGLAAIPVLLAPFVYSGWEAVAVGGGSIIIAAYAVWGGSK